MKKTILTFAAILSISFSSVFAESVDSSRLNNALARTISLSDTFFSRFGQYANALYFGDFDDFIKNPQSMSLNAVWYTGYSVNTDIGVEQAGNLGRGYGDTFAAFCFDRFAVVAGLGGYRYGMFLTGIDLPLPAGDPANKPIVTDFTGTQFFQDIYTINVGIYNTFWLAGYVMTNMEYAPTEGGTLNIFNPQSITTYMGARTHIMGIAMADILLSNKGEFQTFDWAVNPLNIVNLFRGLPLDLNFSLTTGVNWDTIKSSITEKRKSIDWENFSIPIDFSYATDSWSVAGGLKIVNGKNKDQTGTFFPKAYIEGTINLADYLLVGGGVSWLNDNTILAFADGDSDGPQRFGMKANIILDLSVLRVELGWKYNHATDLIDLPEVTDKHIFYLNLACGAPLVKNYKTKQPVELEPTDSTKQPQETTQSPEQ